MLSIRAFCTLTCQQSSTYVSLTPLLYTDVSAAIDAFYPLPFFNAVQIESAAGLNSLNVNDILACMDAHFAVLFVLVLQRKYFAGKFYDACGVKVILMRNDL